MRSRIGVAAVPALLALALGGCVAPPPVRTPVEATLTTYSGAITISATLPSPGEQSTASPTTCVDDAVSWELPGDDAIVTFATTSGSTACPDEEPLNGRFPSWAEPATLPDDAREALVDDRFAHRFALVYTECTNECREWTREMALIDIRGASLLVVAQGISEVDLDGILGTLEIDA